MRWIILCCLFLLPLSGVQAQTQRLSWKPTDFQPLYELPWNEDGGPQDVPKIIERIFREPNVAIRYPVLDEYLHKVPLPNFALAFDVSVMLEGTQRPNYLVAFMLRIWAERNPQAAWERTQQLARLVGFEQGVLGYDAWARPKIEVQDRAALQASRYWISRGALLTFPLAVEASEAPQAEKVRLMKAFADLWFERFQCWPQVDRYSYNNHYAGGGAELMSMFRSGSYDALRREGAQQSEKMSEAAFSVGVRRWLFEHPEEGPKIMQHILHRHWQAGPVAPTPGQGASTTADFLLLWSQLDFKSLLAWSDSVEPSAPEVAWLTRCILMGRVDKAIRERWIAGIDPQKMADRLHVLAPWNPELAMECAIRAKDADMIQDVAGRAVYGLGGTTWNRSHAGLGFIKSFDLQRLSKEMRGQIFEEECTKIMEQWKDVDVGEAARYGFRNLMQQDWPPRDEVLRFLAGDDQFQYEGGMTDRTICSLRVWAVIRPDEMREWIGKQKKADERKALTWLLEHPWGNGQKEREEEE